MSAYLVSRLHIDALVTAMLEAGSKDASTRATCAEFQHEEGRRAEFLGEYLIRANVAGVNARYQDSRPEVRDSMVSEAEDHLPYRYRAVPWAADLTALARCLALLDCYEYQASDAPAWEASIAAKECDSLRSWLGTEIRKLAGITNLWALNEDERTVYTRAVRSGR